MALVEEFSVAKRLNGSCDIKISSTQDFCCGPSGMDCVVICSYKKYIYLNVCMFEWWFRIRQAIISIS